MVDVNLRSINLSKKNSLLNNVEVNVFESDIYSNVKDKYDFIITNPPIRAGKKILLEILDGSKEYLSENGECWFVMRKDHGVKTMIKNLEANFKCQIIDKSKGFYVVMMKNK